MTRGKLFVISGPSGVGKGTICKKLLEADSDMRFSVSMTTRAAREGEVEGVDYYYVSEDKFLELLDEGQLLEYNKFVDNYYGTPKGPIVEWTESGHNVLLDTDYHGAFQVRESYPAAVLIFIAPPSIEALAERIRGRGSETEEQIEGRIRQAMDDMAQSDRYDYLVVNDDINAAVWQVQQIMRIEKGKED
jgi:guanylate kinase